MSTPDPERAVERSADELEERIGGLDASIDDAKKKQAEHQTKDEGPLDPDTADDPDDDEDAGGDTGGFDDPEAEDEEEDEDE